MLFIHKIMDIRSMQEVVRWTYVIFFNPFKVVIDIFIEEIIDQLHCHVLPRIVVALALDKDTVIPEAIKQHNAVIGLIVAEHNVTVSLDDIKVLQGILLDLLKAPMAERDPFFHHAGTGVEVARIWLADEVCVQSVVVH